MELEIGMYVRTINGKIWIIKSQKAISGHKKDIINASYNIINLIEIGDYVNGKKVIDKWEEPDWYGYFIKLEGEETVPTIRKIESIVTKEQFSQIEYRIGE